MKKWMKMSLFIVSHLIFLHFSMDFFKDPQLIQQAVGLSHQGKFQGKPCRVRGAWTKKTKEKGSVDKYWGPTWKLTTWGNMFFSPFPGKNYGNILSTWVVAM